MSNDHQKPELKINQFEGPLDLLFHLIEKNDLDIYDIPIAEITDQYMEFLNEMSTIDLEAASEFLVTAATLVHIKSRMMLPDRRTASEDTGDDPREELVIRLLKYRRCKLLAGELADRHDEYSRCCYRLPVSALSLGIDAEQTDRSLDREAFNLASAAVSERNGIRFADISSKITHILKRDKLSVKEKMQYVWKAVANKGKLFFHELYPVSSTEKIDRVVGFLAILELLRSNRIYAEQKKPFDVILLEEKRTVGDM